MSAYPILDTLPAEERAAWIAQAEAGQALTREQCARLGLLPCDSVVLMPECGGLSPAQLSAMFAGDMKALKDVIRKSKRAHERVRILADATR